MNFAENCATHSILTCEYVAQKSTAVENFLQQEKKTQNSYGKQS
jgi:hypothetical protein